MAHIDGNGPAQIEGACLSATRDELSATIEKIAKLMKMSNHALYRGDVYVKPPEAKAAYVEMMDVSIYINKLLVNQILRAIILKHLIFRVEGLAYPTNNFLQINNDIPYWLASQKIIFRLKFLCASYLKIKHFELPPCLQN